MIDDQFDRAAHRAAEREASAIVEGHLDLLTELSHRELMRRVKTLLSVYVSPRSVHTGGAAVLACAERHVEALAALQSESGLFFGGDNVQSPPDSAFTINDVCDGIELTKLAAMPERLDPIRRRLSEIAVAATEPLLGGGVHTPNHRWELSAALTRIHRSFPSARLVARVEEWLAEGIDIDAHGSYSERSANYASHVTNPSLLLMARVLDRPDLRAIVERNLEATLDLIRPDASVETVQSRRQDQKQRFDLAPYLVHYRSLAIATGRGDLAWAAERSLHAGIDDPTVLAETLLDPQLLEKLPPAVTPAFTDTTFIASLGLATRRHGTVESVVYGGSDYGRHQRIRSGLANNPTFLRLFAGDAILDSVRLSRSFFDVGPFRAATMTQLADARYGLTEIVTAAYYQPLAPVDRRADGAYELGDDGRFSAAMSFPDRPRDELSMATALDIELRADGADIELRIDSPIVPWSLELTFRPGGVFEGVEAVAEGVWHLNGAEGSYRVGDDRIVFGPGAGRLPSSLPLYQPGQEYGFLGGTDAVGGERVYITGTAPCVATLRVRAERVVGR